MTGDDPLDHRLRRYYDRTSPGSAGDPQHAMARGRARRRRQLAILSIAAIVVVAGIAGAALSLWGGDQDSVPVAVEGTPPDTEATDATTTTPRSSTTTTIPRPDPVLAGGAATWIVNPVDADTTLTVGMVRLLPGGTLVGIGSADRHDGSFADGGDVVVRRTTEGWESIDPGVDTLFDITSAGREVIAVGLDGGRPHLGRSTDAGATWTWDDLSDTGLPTAQLEVAHGDGFVVVHGRTEIPDFSRTIPERLVVALDVTMPEPEVLTRREMDQSYSLRLVEAAGQVWIHDWDPWDGEGPGAPDRIHVTTDGTGWDLLAPELGPAHAGRTGDLLVTIEGRPADGRVVRTSEGREWRLEGDLLAGQDSTHANVYGVASSPYGVAIVGSFPVPVEQGRAQDMWLLVTDGGDDWRFVDLSDPPGDLTPSWIEPQPSHVSGDGHIVLDGIQLRPTDGGGEARAAVVVPPGRQPAS